MDESAQSRYRCAMAARHPLYKRVKAELVEALRAGRWKHGQAIPGESTLAAAFGASIGTLRKAVDELVAENILVRQHGRGTFVASHTRDYMLNVFFTIVGRDGDKRLPDTELVSFKRGRADVPTARRLEIAVGAPVLRIRTLLSLRGQPAIVDNIRLPAALFPDLTERAFLHRDTTLYGLYQARYGITVVRTVEEIGAALADAPTRALLGLEPPAAVLRIERTAYTYRDQPVDTRVRYVRTTHHRYLSVLGKR
jgi:GntR family transcriptional regulator